MEVIHKIGRRKTSVASLHVKGKGDITVNKKSYSDFFKYTLQYKILQPFHLMTLKVSLIYP